MSLPTLVQPEEIRVRMQRPAPFSGTELLRVQAICEDASALVRFVSGSNWLDPDNPTAVKAPEIVTLIARRCAERAVRNPEGFSSESAADYSYQRNGMVGEGGLFLTDQEEADLKASLGSGKTGLWTQSTYRGDIWDFCSEWVKTVPGTEDFLYADVPDWTC